MSLLNLTPDELLSTTRAVRKRLDFSRPVAPELIRECLELAVQAPTGSNSQNWHFVVVTDAEKKRAIADFYSRSFASYRLASEAGYHAPGARPVAASIMMKVRDSSQYLADHMHEAPVLLIPCIRGRLEGQPTMNQAATWGSILPAVWSFMLAARARGLGTAWTTLHLAFEQEVAAVLDIPYDKVTQAALVPVAYTIGTDFKPAPRVDLDKIVHWGQW
ncbi:MAG TPA: nitroreductase family protein [Ktedonobacteraceae bacterium]|nr:nitroreductase family protein [Ktedonobacteraceae bacterium]